MPRIPATEKSIIPENPPRDRIVGATAPITAGDIEMFRDIILPEQHCLVMEVYYCVSMKAPAAAP